jgi:predicted negative regulator of RcsB-dependent stress response
MAMVVAAGIVARAAAAQGVPARAAQADPPAVFLSYSFDDDIATGPDTFAVYHQGKGHVRLSQAFHVSGYRSVELRDEKGDGNFPELQGYFPVQDRGRLFFHFAFLTASPGEELNVALAGPRWFQVEKDGIAFWLGTRAGRLVHVTAGGQKPLFAVEAFVWYAVDVAYDVAAGRYDLTVHREGRDDALVALRDQPNAARQAGSAVDKFSFVGSPLTDTSSVHYFVDDVVMSSTRPVDTPPFVAPGRRKLFVDSFLAYRQRLLRRRCLPPDGPEELGLSGEEGAVEREPARAALSDWSAGCLALRAGDAAEAQLRFERAAAAMPEAWLYRLSSVQALVERKRLDEAERCLEALADHSDDPRYAAAAAFVGSARGDLDRAEAWLRDPAARVPDTKAGPLVSEQYFGVLLWQAQFEAARDYARRMGERLARAGLPATGWTERAGDASFYLRDLDTARALYAQAIAAEKDFGALRVLYLKLADVAHLSGDAATERRFREHYYGALE